MARQVAPLLLLSWLACGGGKEPTEPEPSGSTTGNPTDSGTPGTTPTGDTATTPSTTTPTEPFLLWSPDMQVHAGTPCEQQLPEVFWCDSTNPELRWSGVPAGTVSLALLFDDMDYTPGGDPYDHWGVFNLPANATGIEADSSGRGASGSLPAGADEIDGYYGSCSRGQNFYRWRLVALDAVMDPAPRNLADIEAFAATHNLGLAQMCHCPEDDCTP